MIIDGKAIALKIRQQLAQEVAALKQRGVTPGLATILVGDDPASQTYVQQKIKTCQELGIASLHHPLPAAVSEQALLSLVQTLNHDPLIHGILVQLPLPPGLSQERVLLALAPAKDVDGLHPTNQGRMLQCKRWEDLVQARLPLPCTPYGIITLLQTINTPVAGAHAVVLGRSPLVGKPVALLLAALDATVTLCHSRTRDLSAVCQRADILIAAIGRPRTVTAEMVKPGAVVIDVGITRTASGLCGDVDFQSVQAKAGAITPVPGGVGPMTIAMLLTNTVEAAKRSTS